MLSFDEEDEMNLMMKIVHFLEVPSRMQIATEHEEDVVLGTELGYICSFSKGDF